MEIQTVLLIQLLSYIWLFVVFVRLSAQTGRYKRHKTAEIDQLHREIALLKADIIQSAIIPVTRAALQPKEEDQ